MTAEIVIFVLLRGARFRHNMAVREAYHTLCERRVVMKVMTNVRAGCDCSDGCLGCSSRVQQMACDSACMFWLPPDDIEGLGPVRAATPTPLPSGR